MIVHQMQSVRPKTLVTIKWHLKEGGVKHLVPQQSMPLELSSKEWQLLFRKQKNPEHKRGVEMTSVLF